MLWNISEPVLFFAALATFFAALEIGFRVGCRHRDRAVDAAKSHVAAIQAALLGLLALLLGFNFAMAASRFETRKALIQEEVTAIRTTYLRVRHLPPPYHQEFPALLQAYLAARIEFIRAGSNSTQLESANAKASLIQGQLWTLSSEMVAKAPDRSPVLFIQSLNELINVSEKRRDALDNHVPGVVLLLLFTVAVGALGFIAYGYGLTGVRRHVSTAILALMIALVLTTIVDLDEPRSGFIQVSEASMLRLKDSFEESTP